MSLHNAVLFNDLRYSRVKLIENVSISSSANWWETVLLNADQITESSKCMLQITKKGGKNNKTIKYNCQKRTDASRLYVLLTHKKVQCWNRIEWNEMKMNGIKAWKFYVKCVFKRNLERKFQIYWSLYSFLIMIICIFILN